MNLTTVEAIAKAVLYEGYMLYPYRPSSVKNQQRWNFGVLCPQSYCYANPGSDAWQMQTECLVECDSHTGIEVRIRFLQLVDRKIGEFAAPLNEWPADKSPDLLPEFHLVDRLSVAGRVYQPWQEAIEREVCTVLSSVADLSRQPLRKEFHFVAEQTTEPLRDENGKFAGMLLRERKPITGRIELTGEQLKDGLFKVTAIVSNSTSMELLPETTRDQALLNSMASTHTVLGVRNGSFISLLAPPEELAAAAASCKNVGTWPVLVGEEGQRDTLLSSPIILYDYPQIAPESSGDLFDGTEIDEILSLRIMTLTDNEKREMIQSDDRARQMLERTEAMPTEQFMKLHGVLRSLRPVTEETR